MKNEFTEVLKFYKDAKAQMDKFAEREDGRMTAEEVNREIDAWATMQHAKGAVREEAEKLGIPKSAVDSILEVL